MDILNTTRPLIRWLKIRIPPEKARTELTCSNVRQQIGFVLAHPQRQVSPTFQKHHNSRCLWLCCNEALPTTWSLFFQSLTSCNICLSSHIYLLHTSTRILYCALRHIRNFGALQYPWSYNYNLQGFRVCCIVEPTHKKEWCFYLHCKGDPISPFKWGSKDLNKRLKLSRNIRDRSRRRQ